MSTQYLSLNYLHKPIFLNLERSGVPLADLYLISNNRQIKAYNNRLETELFDAQFIVDIGNYVRKTFCNTKEKDFMVGIVRARQKCLPSQ